jgi:hypothetical protein
MNRTVGAGLARVLLLMCLLALAACNRGSPAGHTETPGSLSEPARLAPTGASAAASRPVTRTADIQPAKSPPGGEDPAGWVRYEMGSFAISLPAGWQVSHDGEANMAELYREFEARNPVLAQTLNGEAALQTAVFWALGPESGNRALNESLNIRRTSLNGGEVTDLEGLVGPIEEQYRQFGFDVSSADDTLEIGGQPAAHIAFTLPMVGQDGQQIRVSGHQYLVAASGELWILTYTTEDALLAQQSARSFTVRR